MSYFVYNCARGLTAIILWNRGIGDAVQRNLDQRRADSLNLELSVAQEFNKQEFELGRAGFFYLACILLMNALALALTPVPSWILYALVGSPGVLIGGAFWFERRTRARWAL